MNRPLNKLVMALCTIAMMTLSATAWADGPVRIGNWQLAGSGAGNYPQASTTKLAYDLEFGGAANVTMTDFGQQTGWPSAAQLAQLDVLYMTKFNEGSYTNAFTQANIDDLYDFVARGGHLVYVAEGEGRPGRTVGPLMTKFGLTVSGNGANGSSANPRLNGQNAMGLGGPPNPATTSSWENYTGFPACHNVYGGINWIVPGPVAGSGSVFLSGEVQDFSINLTSSYAMTPKLAKMHDAYIHGTNADVFALDTTGLVDTANANYPCSNYTFPVPFICGDGTVEGPEVCDDGNITPGDGCDATCQTETNYTCPTAGGTCLTVDLVTPVSGTLSQMEPAISGTATPGAVVTVTWTNAQGMVTHTGTVTAAGDGTWSLPARGLPDGAFDVNASVTTTGGTIDDDTDFTIDRMPPPLTITRPTSNAQLNDNTPALRGTTEPGATVSLVVTNSMGATSFMSSPTVNAAGAWSVNASTLPDGDYTLTSTATDAAGNTTQIAVNFTIDTTPPAITLDTPATGTLTNDNTQTISGTAEANAAISVEVLNDSGMSAFSGMVVADANGVWTIDSSALPDGVYTVSVVATDAASNSAPAGPNTFTVDTTAPALTIATPSMGQNSSDDTPTLSGTGEAGLVVVLEVRDAQNMVVATLMPTVAPDGSYTADTTALADGTYSVSAVSADAAGNMSSAGPVSFTIDTMPPQVAIDTPANGVAINDDTPTISGTSEAGAMLLVEVLDNMNNVIQTLTPTSDGMGGWSVDATTLPEGDYSASVTATDAAGNTNKDTVTFTIDTTAPGISITAPTDTQVLAEREVIVSGASEPNSNISVELRDDTGATIETQQTTTDVNGAWSVTFQGVANGDYTAAATSTDDAGNTSDAQVDFSVDSDEPNLTVTEPAPDTNTTETQPDVVGTTDLDATVSVIIRDAQGNEIETLPATVDPVTGAWTVTPTNPLAEGDYLIEVTATRPNGKTTTITVSLTVDTTAPTLTIAQPADGSTTNDTTPTINGTTEPGLEVTVSVKDAQGQEVFTGTATADAQGAWTIDATELASGAYTAEATTADAAGNSTSAGPNNFTLDASAPTVTITAPTAGQAVTDTTPTVTGTAEPGATVEILVDGVKVGEVTADANGDWSTTLDTLTPGTHTIEATSTDGAGNQGSSGEITFTIEETKAPVKIITPVDGNTIGGPEITVTGTGEPGDTITVTVGEQTKTTTVNPDGSWSVDFSNVPDGSTTITATSGEDKVEILVTVSAQAQQYLITGGCSSAPGRSGAPNMAWLLVALGVGLMRRRKR